MESAYQGKEMSDIMLSLKDYMITQLPLPANSMVALAALATGGQKEKIEFLSGRYWDTEDDLEEIIAKEEEIKEKGLYQLRIRKL